MIQDGFNHKFPIYNANGTPFHDLVLKKSVVDSIVMSLGDNITGDVFYKDNSLQVTMHEYIEYNNVKYVLVNPPTIVREGMVADNGELKGMTKYSFTFYHPMYLLGNFPFSDVAVSADEERYLSENKKFSWIGKPDDYIAKINKNLEGTQWIVIKSDRFPEEKEDELSDVLNFDNNTIADVLKTGYDTWGLPYIVDQIHEGEEHYVDGKRFKVIFGLPSNEIYETPQDEEQENPFIFKYGKGVGLKNNSRTPRNNKIITRISGSGGENNIPYGYPQILWYGESGLSFTYGNNVGTYTNVTIEGHTFAKIISYPIYKGILGGQYVELIKHPFTRTFLMPSVYRDTLFNKISFLNEDGTPNTNYDPDIELVDFYDAVYSQEYPYINEINLQAPSYEAHQFEEIKPELGEEYIVDAIPLNADLTPASGWDDSIDDDGKYNQSYFQITLPQLSFDLYACAAITEEMQVNMRSGACIGCTFNVQVDWDDYKNNFYDSDGNFDPVIGEGHPRNATKYPDSTSSAISLILQKENSTFGTLMPNIYQHPASGDAFVILGISLPLSYITNAELRLDMEMKSFMLENNVHYYDYPLKFDEHFLTTHEDILKQITTNTIIRFGFEGEEEPLELFVKQLTIKYGEGVLPKYDITLTDNVEVVLNQIGKVADSVEKLGAIVAILRQTCNRSIWSELDKKLSKNRDDYTPYKLRMHKSEVDTEARVGESLVFGPENTEHEKAYVQNVKGCKIFWAEGGWMISTDYLSVNKRMYAKSIQVDEVSHVGGEQILTDASCVADGVIPFMYSNGQYVPQTDAETIVFFRVFFRRKSGEGRTIYNQFRTGDLAYCQIFNIDAGISGNFTNKYYWRKIKDTSNGKPAWAYGDYTSDEFHYIDLSNVSGEFDSAGVMRMDADAEAAPSADDPIVQLGYIPQSGDDALLVQERQGATIVSGGGQYKRAIMMFEGIASFSLPDPRVKLSPHDVQIVANSFNIKTSYGQTYKMPIERGDWESIPQEDGQTDSLHRCYYYDIVQHGGSTWLCMYQPASSSEPEYTTEEPSYTSLHWIIYAKEGAPASSYTEEAYAWSNAASVANVTTEPTPNSGWQSAIGAQGSYTYLWRKSIKYRWNSNTRVYVADAAQYFRMSGTNGTSIRVKGTVSTVSALPSVHDDGDSYVVSADRHLYMWSEEGNRWLDIGEFKGENGKTFYTHIAWATNIVYNSNTGEVTRVDGFVIAKSPDDTTHHWMGVLVNENSATDSTESLLYTWSYTKGDDGTSPWFADLDNEMDSVRTTDAGDVTSTQTIATTPVLYMGSSPVAFTLTVKRNGVLMTLGTASNNVTASFANGTLSIVYAAGASISEKDEYTLTLTSTDGVSRDAVLTVTTVSGDRYNIIPSQRQISVGRDGSSYSPATATLTCGYTKEDNSGVVTTVSDVADIIDGKYNLFFRRRNRASGNMESYYNLYSLYKSSLAGFSVSAYDMVEFILCGNTSSRFSGNILRLIDRETVPVVSDGQGGDEGAPAITATLEPGSLPVQCDNDGHPLSAGSISILPWMYEGASELEDGSGNTDTFLVTKINGVSVDGGDSGTDAVTGLSWYIPMGQMVAVFSYTVASVLVSGSISIEVTADTRSVSRTVTLPVQSIREGEIGEDSVNIIVTPASLIVNQDMNSADNLGHLSEAVNFTVVKGTTNMTVTAVSVASVSHCAAQGGTSTATLTAIGTKSDGAYYDTADFTCSVTYRDGSTSRTVTGIKVRVYANLLGIWSATVKNDTETAVAASISYGYYNGDTSMVLRLQDVGTYIRSAETNISALEETVGDPTSPGDGTLLKRTSTIEQTVNSISLKVNEVSESISNDRGNLLYNAYFDELLCSIASTSGSPTSATVRVQSSTSVEYGENWLRFYLKSSTADATLDTSMMGTPVEGKGLKLKAGTYTFSGYARKTGTFSYLYITAYASASEDMASSTVLGSLNYLNSTNSETDYKSVSFTVSSSKPYVAFKVRMKVTARTTNYFYVDAVKLEKGSVATMMTDTSYSSRLLATGIDITNRKITVTSDTFEIQNNSGEKTFDVNEYGDVIIYGAINTQTKVLNSSNWGQFARFETAYYHTVLDWIHLPDIIEIDSSIYNVTDAPSGASYYTLILPAYGQYLTSSGTSGGDFDTLDSSAFNDGFVNSAADVRKLLGRKFIIRNSSGKNLGLQFDGTFSNGDGTFTHQVLATGSDILPGRTAILECVMMNEVWASSRRETVCWHVGSGGESVD